MESASAQVSRSRPFYSTHADAYDVLVTDPVGPWVRLVHERLTARGADRGTVLDAGCGTGRHAAALLALGHPVTLADASPRLLALAARRCPTSAVWLVDLCALVTDQRFDAVTCRGVLNDLLTDEERDAALRAMARCLRPGGLVVLDVREAAAARARADGTPRRRTVQLPGGGTLRFTSTSRWSDGLVRVHEEHLVHRPDAADVLGEHDFAMRPWSAAELDERLQRAGLAGVRTEPGVGRRTPDRLLATAVHP